MKLFRLLVLFAVPCALNLGTVIDAAAAKAKQSTKKPAADETPKAVQINAKFDTDNSGAYVSVNDNDDADYEISARLTKNGNLSGTAFKEVTSYIYDDLGNFVDIQFIDSQVSINGTFGKLKRKGKTSIYVADGIISFSDGYSFQGTLTYDASKNTVKVDADAIGFEDGDLDMKTSEVSIKD